MAIRKNYEAFALMAPMRDAAFARKKAAAEELLALTKAYEALDARATKALEKGDMPTALRLAEQCVDQKAKVDAQQKKLDQANAAALDLMGRCADLVDAITDEMNRRVKDEKEHVAKHEARIVKASARLNKAIDTLVENAIIAIEKKDAKAKKAWEEEAAAAAARGEQPDSEKPQNTAYDRRQIRATLQSQHKLTAEEAAKVDAAQKRIAHYKKIIEQKSARYKAIADALRADSTAQSSS